MGEGSLFLHSYTVGGERVFFHSLTLELCGSPSECPDPALERELLRRYRKRASEDRGVVMSTLFLTTACPRECAYCFLADAGARDMTEAEIDRALQLTGPGPADVLLYGGEPLARPGLVSHTLQQVRSSDADLNVLLATGGRPVDSGLAEELASADAFIIVSMDGPPEVHNHLRPLRGGGDSFAGAEATFAALREAGCRVGISMTLTDSSTEGALESFLWLMERFRPDDMGLNPWLHPLPGGGPNPHQVSGERALAAVTACMEEAIDRGMYVEQLARRTRPFANRSPRLKDCAVAGGRLVAVPGGRAGICDCRTACGGQYVPLEDEAALRSMMREALTLSPVLFDDCLGCPALSICGGGCRYDALHASGDIRGRRPERCAFERGFLAWMIGRTVERGRDSLVPAGGFDSHAMPMPVGTMLGEDAGGAP